MEKPLIICTTVLVEKSPQALPLGAACIASALRHDAVTADRFQTALVSVSAEDSAYEAAVRGGTSGAYVAEQICARGTPSFVCFSVYVWNRAVMESAAAAVKQRAPNVVCIAGGPEITANPASCAAFDYTVAGEGERAVPQLIAQIARAATDGTTVTELPQGVLACSAEKKQGASSENQNSVPAVHATAPDITTLESPYLDGTLDPAPYGGVLWELARGCPFRCSYCYESKGEKRVRYIPLERIEKELELFNRKKVTQVFVLDPTYNADKKRALQLLSLIARKAPGMFCEFEVRAEFIDRELAHAFTKIPCSLQIGLQSVHEDVLANVNRSFDKKKFIRNVDLLNDEGVVFGFDLIYGLPGDSLSGFRDSIDFALSLYPNNLELFCLSVLPGTDLYDRAQELHLTFQQTPPYHVMHTDRFSPADIERAAEIAHSCSVFYNQGRAVPWFLTVCRALKEKPSTFFSQFAQYCASLGTNRADRDVACSAQIDIEKVQTVFVRKLCTDKQHADFADAAEDIIRLNGALSRSLSDGSRNRVELRYDSEDLMSPYASDLVMFVKNARRRKCTAETFPVKGGADWKKIW